MMLIMVRLVKRATRWLLRNRRYQLAPSALIEEFGPPIGALNEALAGYLRADAATLYQERHERYLQAGVHEELAAGVAICLHAFTGLAIADVAAASGSDLLEVAQLYYQLGERLELDWFGGLILSGKVENEWQAMAREAYLEDLQWQQSTLAQCVLHGRAVGQDIAAALESWEAREATLLERWRGMLGELHAVVVPDFAMFAVANRELLDLAQSGRRPEQAAAGAGAASAAIGHSAAAG